MRNRMGAHSRIWAGQNKHFVSPILMGSDIIVELKTLFAETILSRKKPKIL